MVGPPVVVEQAVANADAETASATLWAAGATAVEVRQSTETTTLIASFPSAHAARTVAAELGARAVEITDSSWQDAWRAYAAPVDVTSRLMVAPAWKQVRVGGGRLVLDIDPGACFGSGSHPSTRLVLWLLAERSLLGKRVVDVGTGSGILAVAAARLGAVAVTAIDIDPGAVAVTAANADRNHVGPLVDASTTPVHAVPGTFDIAVINVTAAVHATLGPAVMARVRAGGELLIAGLLPGQWRHVASGYRGATIESLPDLDGWTGAVLRRDN